jgi:hypothetical protein
MKTTDVSLAVIVLVMAALFIGGSFVEKKKQKLLRMMLIRFKTHQ